MKLRRKTTICIPGFIMIMSLVPEKKIFCHFYYGLPFSLLTSLKNLSLDKMLEEKGCTALL